MGGMMIMGKLIKSIILGTLLFVILSLGSNAYASSYGVVADEDRLNVRTGPGTEYSVITSLPFGSLVKITNESNGWYYIENCLFYTEVETTYTRHVGGWCAANRIGDYEFWGGGKGTINAPDTNIRRGPGSGSQIITVAQPGDHVMLLGHTSSGWFCIKYFGIPGTYWVYDEFISH